MPHSRQPEAAEDLVDCCAAMSCMALFRNRYLPASCQSATSAKAPPNSAFTVLTQPHGRRSQLEAHALSCCSCCHLIMPWLNVLCVTAISSTDSSTVCTHSGDSGHSTTPKLIPNSIDGTNTCCSKAADAVRTVNEGASCSCTLIAHAMMCSDHVSVAALPWPSRS